MLASIDQNPDLAWTNSEFSVISRNIAIVMVLGGLVAQAWAWLPSSSPLRGSIIVSAAGAAVTIAGLLLYGPGRALGPRAMEIALGFVPVIVALAHSLYPREYLVAAYSTGTAAFFLWTTPVLVTVLGSAAGVRHVGLSSLCVGLSLIDTSETVGGWPSFRIWMMVTATMMGIAMLGRVLNKILFDRAASRRSIIEQLLVFQATHDPLTGLPNRRLVETALDEALHEHDTVVMVFIDLDDFKLVNDTLGHQAGDEILIAVANRLRDHFPTGTTIGRFGGDEFVAVVPSPETGVRAVKKHLEELWIEPFSVNGQLIHLRGSSGLASSHGKGFSARRLTNEADSALLVAKARGRAQAVVFDSSMNTRDDDHVLSQALHEVLKSAPESIELGYQPIVDLRTHRVAGVEALLRWQPPTTSWGRGPVGPARIVAVAERSGLINAIGQVVLERALQDVATLRRELDRDDLYVNINVSPMQLLQESFLPSLFAALAEAELPSTAIRIEITESALVDDLPRAKASLELLRDARIKIALDDFGTGYSSLGLLKDLPLDMLKIDRTFTQQVINPDTQVFVKAIVALGRSFKLDVVAEGAETSEEISELRNLGCQFAQGHYYSEALPVDLLVGRLGAIEATPIPK